MSITPSMRFKVLHRDGFKCVYCGKSAPDVELEVDHVIASSRGGPDHVSNLTTACWTCNRGKAARGLETPVVDRRSARQAAAAELGRAGGLKGGKRRAEILSPARRTEIAQQAAKSRWSKWTQTRVESPCSNQPMREALVRLGVWDHLAYAIACKHSDTEIVNAVACAIKTKANNVPAYTANCLLQGWKGLPVVTPSEHDIAKELLMKGQIK